MTDFERGSEPGAAPESGGLSSGLADIDRKLRALQDELANAAPAPAAPSGTAPPAPPAPVRTQEDAALELIARAEQQAEGIVQAAHERVLAMNRQVEEMMRLREAVRRATEQLLADFGAALERLDRVDAPARPPAPDVATSVAAPGPRTLQGDIVVTAEPFAQVTDLAAFVQALGSVRGAGEVSVHAFDGHRAEVAVSLAEPVALARELSRLLPFGVEVAAESERAISLRLDAANLA